MKSIEQHSLTGIQVAEVTQIERFQGAFEATKFQRPIVIEELKRTSIITSSGASTRIEGALLADKQVKELVEGGCRITKMSSRSEREVAGYVKALSYIYTNFEELEISERTIRELHQLLASELTEGQLPKKQRGAYKDTTNDVVETDNETGNIIKVWFKTVPPGPATTTAMSNLVLDYKSCKKRQVCQPLILIAGFVVHFLAIHPFRDGNGRLSRLLTTLLLLRHGYHWAQYTSHEKVIEDNKDRYYVSLRTTQSTFTKARPEYNPWFDFFLKIVSMQVEFLKGRLVQNTPATVLNENEMRIHHLIATAGECSISYLLKNSDMTRPGLKSLLKRLRERDLVEVKGQGKGTTYRVK